MEQRSEAWHDVRLGMITASQFDKLMGIKGIGKTGESYIKSCVVEAVTNFHQEVFSTAMSHGVENEHDAFMLINDKINFEPCTFMPYDGDIKEFIGYIGGTPDGVNETHTLEIKCPFNSVYHFDRLINPIALFDDYKWQVLGEMMVAKKEGAIVASYDPRFPSESQLVTIEIELKDYQSDFDLMVERLHDGIKMYKDLVQQFNNRK